MFLCSTCVITDFTKWGGLQWHWTHTHMHTEWQFHNSTFVTNKQTYQQIPPFANNRKDVHYAGGSIPDKLLSNIFPRPNTANHIALQPK